MTNPQAITYMKGLDIYSQSIVTASLDEILETWHEPALIKKCKTISEKLSTKNQDLI